jgi:hypothetical protein
MHGPDIFNFGHCLRNGDRPEGFQATRGYLLTAACGRTETGRSNLLATASWNALCGRCLRKDPGWSPDGRFIAF